MIEPLTPVLEPTPRRRARLRRRAPARGWPRLPRAIRRLLPRTFQGRLALAFIGVIALTLVLVTVLVLNRLDDYFTRQQTTDLEQRAETVISYVQTLARLAAGDSLVVGPDRQDPEVLRVNPDVTVGLLDNDQQRVIADRLGQADVQIRFGLLGSTGEDTEFVAGRRRAAADAPAGPAGRRADPGAHGRGRAHPPGRWRCSSPTPSRSPCPTRTRSGRPPWPTSPGCWRRSRSSPSA